MSLSVQQATSTHGLVRRVEIPMSPWAYLGGDLRNSMWKVASEASKIDQVGTEQTATVVWGSVLLRSPRIQNGVPLCHPRYGEGLGC